MKIQFDILFSCGINHNFYTTNKLPEIRVQPDLNTSKLLNSLGMLFKEVNSGFLILFEVDTTEPGNLALRPLTENGKFTFKLFLTDNYLNNYSDLPLDHKRPKIFYFNNLTENIDGSKLLLSKGATVSENDRVQLCSSIYQLEVPSGKQSVVISLRNIHNDLVYSKRVPVRRKEVSDPAGMIIESLDLSSWSPGVLYLYIDGVRQSSLYADDEASREPVFGIAEFYYGANIPLSYQFTDSNGVVSKKDYSFQLARRLTNWKYYVVLKNTSTDPGFTLEYGPLVPEEAPYPAGVNFVSKTPESMITDVYGVGNVLLFESDKLLPFYETPKKNIRLNKPVASSGGPTTEAVIKHLPNASKSFIKPNVDNTKVYSEIFVYV